MAVIYTQHFAQFFDDNGNPLSGGKLYTYSAGTTTPKPTYTTEDATVENANPVILDSAGRATIFILGSYRFDLFDANDVLIDSTDDVTSFTTLNESGSPFFQSFSGNGSQTAFTLSKALGTDSKNLMVFVDSGGNEGFEIQTPNAYSLSGTALTFTAAPASGTNNIYVFAPSELLGEAAASAAAAAASEAAAAASETAAATSASNAATSEANAAASETAAANSATQAAGSASNIPAANAAGTVDAITADFTPNVALTNGTSVVVRAAGANTSAAPTFNPDALGDKTIVKGNDLALVAGDIAGAGHWIEMQYDSTLDKWVLQNPAKGIDVGAVTLTGNQTIAGDKQFSDRVELKNNGAYIAAESAASGRMRIHGNSSNEGSLFLSATDSTSSTNGALIELHGSSHASTPGRFNIIPGSNLTVTDIGVNIHRGYLLVDSIVVGSPTGGAQGAGIVNAEGFKDDGANVTCTPLHLYINGHIDLEFWDSLVPDREVREKIKYEDTGEKDEDGKATLKPVVVEEARIEPRIHFGAHRFSARTDPNHPDYVPAHDPRTLEGQMQHLRDKNHLTMMPNLEKYDPLNGALSLGEWVQRLQELGDLLFLYIWENAQRIKQVKEENDRLQTQLDAVEARLAALEGGAHA